MLKWDTAGVLVGQQGCITGTEYPYFIPKIELAYTLHPYNLLSTRGGVGVAGKQRSLESALPAHPSARVNACWIDSRSQATPRDFPAGLRGRFGSGDTRPQRGGSLSAPGQEGKAPHGHRPGTIGTRMPRHGPRSPCPGKRLVTLRSARSSPTRPAVCRGCEVFHSRPLLT